MKTDTSEKGLEALIVADMTGRKAPPGGGFSDDPEPFVGLHNWLLGDPKSYDRAWTVDLVQLRTFIAATQPPSVAALDLDNDSPVSRKFLARLQGEIGKRGAVTRQLRYSRDDTANCRIWHCSSTGYRNTILSDETDLNRLHDLKAPSCRRRAKMICPRASSKYGRLQGRKAGSAARPADRSRRGNRPGPD